MKTTLLAVVAFLLFASAVKADSYFVNKTASQPFPGGPTSQILYWGVYGPTMQGDIEAITDVGITALPGFNGVGLPGDGRTAGAGPSTTSSTTQTIRLATPSTQS